MATYKVLQDIEAEDKFVGPLTLKQFIFAAIAAVCIWLSFIFLTRGLWVLVIPLVPVIFIMGFLAFPWGRDQPTEIWLLAKIRFYFKPRKRIWDQTGIQQMVKVTAPPKATEYLTDNLSQTEVKSRLRALADTIDTRGWVVKNSSGPSGLDVTAPDSDRLIDAETILPKAVGDDLGVKDIFDENSTLELDNQIKKSGQEHKSNIKTDLLDIRDSKKRGRDPKENFWFLNQPQSNDPNLTTFATQSIKPASEPLLNKSFSTNKMESIDEADALSLIESKHIDQNPYFHNHKSLNPGGNNIQTKPNTTVTPTPSPDTIRDARNNDQVVKNFEGKGIDDGEVIVPLH